MNDFKQIDTKTLLLALITRAEKELDGDQRRNDRQYREQTKVYPHAYHQRINQIIATKRRSLQQARVDLENHFHPPVD